MPLLLSMFLFMTSKGVLDDQMSSENAKSVITKTSKVYAIFFFIDLDFVFFFCSHGQLWTAQGANGVEKLSCQH